jgi:soluble P-type ATPase
MQSANHAVFRNDFLMLKEAAPGITMMQAEGAATRALMRGDLVVCNILDALDPLANPLRLIATLRS